MKTYENVDKDATDSAGVLKNYTGFDKLIIIPSNAETYNPYQNLIILEPITTCKGVFANKPLSDENIIIPGKDETHLF